MEPVLYKVLSESSIYSHKFKIYGKKLTIRIDTAYLKRYSDLLVILNLINKILQEIIMKLLESVPDNYNVRLNMSSESLSPDIFTGFIPKNLLTVDKLMNEVVKVSQSKSDFLLSDDLALEIISIPNYRIGGNSKKFLSIDEWIYRSKKVVRVKPDGLCLGKSIILSIAHAENLDRKAWTALRRDSNKILTKKAMALYKESNVDYDFKKGINLDDLHRIQNLYLNKYQIIAVTPPDTFLYKGIPAEKQIYILINSDKTHADSLLSIKAFLKYDHFCVHCFKGYQNYTWHKCQYKCPKCFDNIVCVKENPIYCEDCNQKFASQSCFNKHKVKRVCEKRKICKICGKMYFKNHICGKKLCGNCHEIVDISNHHCYIMPLDKNLIAKQDKVFKVFIFFDIETFLQPTNNGLTHVPNQICSVVCCDNCWDPISKNKIPNCEQCTSAERCYFGLDCVRKFLHFIFVELNNEIYNRHKNIKYICFAHNGKAFDFHFIILDMLNNRQKPKILKRGSKILCIEHKNFKFVDSINFITLPLAKFSSTFGIPDINKGEFPFKFNQPINWEYVGYLPSIEFYAPEKRKDEEAIKLIDWYKGNRLKVFVFKDEIEKYCHNDVIIMMKCVMLYRSIWIERYKIDCFTRAITLPAAVMEVFRYSYLKPKTLGIIPQNGYESQRKSSYTANIWLDYIELISNISLIREYKIIHFYVDGYHKSTNTIYEFFGCFYHGCPKCFRFKRNERVNNRECFDKLYKQTLSKIEILKKFNFNLIIKWECEWNNEIAKDPNLKYYFKNHLRLSKNRKALPPLNPREALIGGRVNAAVLYIKSGNGKINHYDIRSLYPFVNKRSKYPYGHPKIIKNIQNSDIDQYEGLIFCRILPPQDLYFPVLGIRIEDKLVFPLCYECARDKANNCDHDDYDRSLISVWVIPEVKLALREGYRIMEIFEIWHFEQVSETLFTQFINDGIKDKIEASGWPNSVVSDEDKIKYINDFKAIENIELDPNRIQDNPGKRFQGKGNVNCFWGRFGMNSASMRTCLITSEPNDLFTKLIDPTLTLHDVKPYNSDIIEICYSKKQMLMEENRNSNIIIADYTTAYARIILYEYLKKLGRRVIYFDTDSIIFYSEDRDWMPPLGDFIGDLTDEIGDENKTIDEFVCCGPKSYAYSIFDQKTMERSYVIKIKGIRLNVEAKYIITFDSLVKLVKEFCENDTCYQSYDVKQTTFATTTFNDIICRENFKQFKITYDKRFVLKDFTTRPFGYKI